MRTLITLLLGLSVVLASCQDEARLSREGGLPSPAQSAPTPTPTEDAGPVDVGPPPPARADAGPAAPDAAPPPPPVTLVIDAPARGARIGTARVAVTGRLTGGVAPTLTVGGAPVVPGPDGAFSTDVPAALGLTRIITEVVDEAEPVAQDVRAVLRGADADPGEAVDDAVRITLGPDGLDALGDVVAAYVADLDLAALAGGAGGDFEIESLTYDRVGVELTPRNGYLAVRLVIYGMTVRLNATVDLVFEVTIRGSATAREAVIDAELRLAPTADGGVDVDVSGAQVSLNGFDYDINNVPGFAEDWFLDRVRGYAEGLLADALSDFVVPALFDPSALDQSVDILGTTIDLGLRVQATDVTPDGLSVALSARATTPRVVRPGDAMPAVMGEGTHGGAHADGAARGALFDRLIHAAWAGGVLDLTVGPGGVAELPAGIGFGLFRGALGEAAEGLPRDAELVLRTRPLLPPVTRIEAGARPLVVDVGDMLLDIDVAGRVLATVSLHLLVRVALSVMVDDAGIQLVPDLTVEAWTDVADAPVAPVDAEALEQRVATFAQLLPGLVAGQSFAVGADALPIPVDLANPRVEAEPPAWLHVRADLVAP